MAKGLITSSGFPNFRRYMKLMLTTGTRPEIIKMAPLIRRLKPEDLIFVHSGQHYDYNLSTQFIRELGLPSPTEEFHLSTNEPALQTSELVKYLHKAVLAHKPNIVCVEGDTNTVLAASLAAIKNKVPLAHLEAGLRSGDWRMPEEHNRIVADHISDLLFAPTILSKRNLVNENVHGEIHVTGNTIIDAVNENMRISETKAKVTLPDSEFVLVTLHRAENVDDPRILSNLIKSFAYIPTKIVFPIHPRTSMNLKRFSLDKKLANIENIVMMPPVGYFDFLRLMKNCKFIITDSGGIQEEATASSIRKLVLVLRRSTERPEAVKSGFVKVIGTDPEPIIKAINKTFKNFATLTRRLPTRSPYGDGKSAQRIKEIIMNYMKERAEQ